MEAAQNPTHTSLESALQEVLKTSQSQNGLVMGIHQCAKALDKREALLCILAKNCDEPDYVKLVEGLCNEHKIDLVKVEDSKELGEWSGLCKVDREGNARKIVGTSCVVIKDWVMETPGLHYLQQSLKIKV